MNPEDEVFKNFLVEMGEKLEELEESLSELEQGYSSEVMNKLFRAVHTIKGGGGFFGLTKVSELSHVFEDLLMKVREGELEFGEHMIAPFYSACDALKEMHESTDYGNSTDVSALCFELKAVHGGEVSAPVEASVQQDESQDEVSPAQESEQTVEEESPKAQEPAPSDKTEDSGTSKDEGSANSSKPQTKTPQPATPDKSSAQNETIRVKVDLLNKLMELTGEIVLGRNQLLRQFSSMEDKSNLVAMAHMISDLQQLVLQTRMQPIGGTFTKFKRIVRDLSKQLDKPIELVIKGEDTELDRSIIESLSDPLTHLIRNCADHGLEDPSSRVNQGKDRVGTVRLQARHEGGQVVITVEDDGKGIDAGKVKGEGRRQQLDFSDRGGGHGRQRGGQVDFSSGTLDCGGNFQLIRQGGGNGRREVHF